MMNSPQTTISIPKTIRNLSILLLKRFIKYANKIKATLDKHSDKRFLLCLFTINLMTATKKLDIPLKPKNNVTLLINVSGGLIKTFSFTNWLNHSSKLEKTLLFTANTIPIIIRKVPKEMNPL